MKLVDKILLEGGVRPKKRLGQGETKEVYPFEKNPNYVIKYFPGHNMIKKHGYTDENAPEKIEKEIAFANKFPNLFAETFKVDYNRGILIQERLDTDKFQKDVLEAVERAKQFIKFGWSETGYIDNDFEHLTSRPVEFFKKKMPNDKFIFKLLRFLNSVEKAAAQTDSFSDMHVFQMGYDKRGNIKLFDL